MTPLLRALRHAVRQFLAARAFTLTAVLTLALGIGGTTAIATLIHAIMLRSLPVTDPSSLYRIGDGDNCCVQGGPQDRWGMFSYPLVQRLVAAAPEFAEVAAVQAGTSRVSVRRQGLDAVARPLRARYVTGNYFTTFGVGAAGGRVIAPADDQPSATPVVVLSHHAWQNAYGGDTGILGTTLIVEGQPFEVAGIAAAGFFGETLSPDPPDLWIPLHQEPLLAGKGSLLDQPVAAWLRVIGRLRSGASIDGMAPRLTGALHQWLQHESGYPQNWMADVVRTLPSQTIAVVPAGAGVAVMREEYGRSLRILLGVCALVLLVACANVANLLLVRAVARRQQTAIRLSLGASRARIVGEALVESVLLALMGGVAGLLVAMWAARLLLALAFTEASFLPISTRPSWEVLTFAVVLSTVTGMLFGAAPAWLATRTDPIEALRGSGRSTGDHAGFARRALLVMQAALAVVLVAGATLLGRSLGQLEQQDFGFDVEDRVVVSLNRLPATYTLPQLQATYRAVEDRMTRLPGVQGGGLALYNPLTDNWGELILIAGRPAPRIDTPSGASWNRVSADYLRRLGVDVVRGRGFTAADDDSSEPVAVVNQAFVKRFFRSDEDALDQRFGLNVPENASTFRIVGVVRDAKFAGFGLDRPARPMFYVPLAQHVNYPQPIMQRVELQSHFVRGLMLVTALPPSTLEPMLAKALAEVDPNLTITSVRTLAQQVSLSFNQPRAVARLAGLFGIIALVLAAIGLYGVTAYSVAQRTGEIGLRMALGADRRRVLSMVVRVAFRDVAAGLVLGLPLAVAAGRLLAAQLYNVSFWDPITLGMAAGALGACSLIAALIPASRAAAISPMRALRAE